MNDLIDRKEILRSWQNVCIGISCSICQFHNINDTMDEECLLERWVHSLPSAQPEIIRCKDCAKREYCRTSTVWAVAPPDDWFCADAERRDDG